MTASIPTAHSNPLYQLLEIFNAKSLGEGDLGAGANVLVAKSISLANPRTPGTCLISPKGDRLQVGLSFVAVGGLTESLIGEKVLDPIARIQNNLGDHLAADAAYTTAKLAALTKEQPRERTRARPAEPAATTRIGEPENRDRGIDGSARRFRLLESS